MRQHTHSFEDFNHITMQIFSGHLGIDYGLYILI